MWREDWNRESGDLVPGPLWTHLVTSVITAVTGGTLWEAGLLGSPPCDPVREPVQGAVGAQHSYTGGVIGPLGNSGTGAGPAPQRCHG